MAKLNGPLGSKLRGKVGEVVAAKIRGGETAIRSYQPKVKNPNTKAQIGARSAFSLMSKLAAQLSGALMMNAKPNETQRNAFIRVNRPFVVLDDQSPVGSVNIDAKIRAEKILISQGTEDIASDITFAAVSGQTDKVKIVDGYTGSDKLLLVVAYVEDNQQLAYPNVKTYVFDNDTVDCIVDSPAATRGDSMVLVYRVTATEGFNSANYSNYVASVDPMDLTVIMNGRSSAAALGMKASATAHLNISI